MEVRLETVRTHQIRVHMNYLGHSIYGDYIYGDKNNKLGQFLHAKSLGFTHPMKNEYMFFDSKLPKYFSSFLDNLI
jgi:23S rRNA pseudouridine1911/1915/1917 synthase